MDIFTLPPLAALLDLSARGLMALIAVLTPVAGPGAAAAAVVLVTLLVRMALVPAGVAQAKADQARSRLAPRLRALQKRWRAHPERLQRETLALYRVEGVSPAAGCLPPLIQAPVVGLVYAVFLHGSIAGHTNPLLGEHLLGVPLGQTAVAVATSGFDGAAALVFGVIVVLIALIGELTRRLLRPAVATTLPPGQRLLVETAPFLTAVVALFVPLAAAVYLLTTVTWTLGQRLVLRRLYPPHPPHRES
ncbi:membrane protein insertase, YidC/Oxa1 family [Microbacterium laevaniformans OR221]|nr:membrane protein insertase, YidC/Oxa1 family [Microbacterium laevaniformans OR221]